MAISKKARNWIIFGIGVGVSLPVLFIIFSIWIIIAGQKDRTLYTISANGYDFRVDYYPGGGAIGPNRDIKVYITGGRWQDELLAYKETADSVDIVFVDTANVKITFLQTRYLDQSHYYWIRTDSVTFNLDHLISPARFQIND